MTDKPLFPDDMVRRYECWNCGSKKNTNNGHTFICECECGWTNRFGITPGLEASQREFREANMARQCNTTLVDFTQPDAISSPG